MVERRTRALGIMRTAFIMAVITIVAVVDDVGVVSTARAGTSLVSRWTAMSVRWRHLVHVSRGWLTAEPTRHAMLHDKMRWKRRLLESSWGPGEHHAAIRNRHRHWERRSWP